MIEVHELTKKYGPNTAVDGLTFTVKAGTVRYLNVMTVQTIVMQSQSRLPPGSMSRRRRLSSPPVLSGGGDGTAAGMATGADRERNRRRRRAVGTCTSKNARSSPEMVRNTGRVTHGSR